ncbi:MAG: hypothetical protein F4093_10930 [Gammaproteobacteria bacterium]|nr:hypothetical protein [Gammaproteobacteria bacterium]
MKWSPGQLRWVMVGTYTLACIAARTRPWKYFQLNAPWFNLEKGIFSKLDLNVLFPAQWRLELDLLDAEFRPARYPVWLKPEWGENANGVFCVGNETEYQQIKDRIVESGRSYVVQQAATGKREFELFTIQDCPDSESYAVFSITEVTNGTHRYPVNGIYNPETSYHDISDRLQPDQKTQILEWIVKIGRFPISRLCVRADSIEDVVSGNFQIIEINLYTPMPIHLLDSRYSNRDCWSMIRHHMLALARATRNRDRSRQEKPVYTRMLRHRINSMLAGAPR